MAPKGREAVQFAPGLRVRSFSDLDGDVKYYVLEDGARRVGPYPTEEAANDGLTRVIERDAERSKENRRIAAEEGMIPMATTAEKKKTNPKAKTKPKAKAKAAPKAKTEKKTRERKPVKAAKLGHVQAKDTTKTTHRVASKKPLTAVCGSRNVANAKDPVLFAEIPDGLYPCWKCEKMA